MRIHTVQVLKWEKLINSDGCLMDDVRADLRNSEDVPANFQTFITNTDEHLILGGNPLLDIVTVIILPKFSRKALYYSLPA